MWWSSGRPDRISFAARRMKDVVEYSDMQSEEAKSGAAQEMLDNSLQIVASILSLKARTVKSHEARVHSEGCLQPGSVHRRGMHELRSRAVQRACACHSSTRPADPEASAID